MSDQADAPEAPASPEALDAAAAAASSGAAPTAAPPSPETPGPAAGESGEGPSLGDYVTDESLDLDSADLPDATKAELRTLRKQTKAYREAATPWTNATKGWQDADIDTLRAALEQGPDNPEVVGEWMLKSAQSLLGDRFSEILDVPEVGDVDDDGKTLTASDVAKLVTQAMAERDQASAAKAREAEMVAEINATATELGFGPSHPLYASLLFLARNQTEGDLTRAAELLREANGVPTTAAPSAPAEAGHTPAPPEGGTPDGTKRPSSARAAAEERLSKVLGNARGFPQ